MQKPTSPGKMGDTIYGMNVSFVDHLDIGLSLGGVLLLLLIIGALCASDDPWQAFHPPPPAPDLSLPEYPAATVNVDGDQHDGDCPCSKSHSGFYGRRNRHASEKESIDRTPAKEVAVDGASPNESQSRE